MAKNELDSIKEIARINSGVKWRLSKWLDDLAGRGLSVELEEVYYILWSLEPIDAIVMKYSECSTFDRITESYKKAWNETKICELITNAKGEYDAKRWIDLPSVSLTCAELGNQITDFAVKLVNEYMVWVGSSTTSDWFYATEIYCLVKDVLSGVERILEDVPEDYLSEFLARCKHTLRAPMQPGVFEYGR